MIDLDMSLATAELPTDLVSLRAFALACQGELKAAELAVQYNALEIEKLKFQIAKLRRMQFGRSSERINRQIAQLELRLEELESGMADAAARAEAEVEGADPARAIPSVPMKVRHQTPGNLDLRARKDYLAHAHAPDTDRCRGRRRHERRPKADGRGGAGLGITRII